MKDVESGETSILPEAQFYINVLIIYLKAQVLGIYETRTSA
jgi:hypothetical protein